MNSQLPNIIPLPAEISPGDKRFAIDKQTSIVAHPALMNEAIFLQKFLIKDYSFLLDIVEKKENNFILLKTEPSPGDINNEEYEINIDERGISITAKNSSGIFYGIQTLHQLLPFQEEIRGESLQIPFMGIKDSPRFSWRGFMLDIARHFSDTAVIKQIIDAMALLKLNILHLHLCDDQGWRLEIDAFPRLTEVASVRSETQRGGFLGRKTDKTPHYGFLNKDDLRTIIDYAAERHITIIPEIEMPGHCTAALAAYPEMGCTGGPYEVATFSGIKKDIYCAGKEETFAFLQKILDEVMELFPSPWIHIGGDEAPKDRWEKCPRCQERIKSENLKDENELQAYFINRIIGYLEEKGKTAIGWNEIISESLPSSAIAQYWLRNKKEVLQHLRKGGKIIASHFFHSYLDYNHGILPLRKVYGYNPFPRRLEKQYHENIIGLEAPMWTETITSSQHLHAYIFPRLTAMAENAWTPPEKKISFENFRDRLPHLLERLRNMGISHTSITESSPGLGKRLIMWSKLARQSSDMPAAVENGDKK